LALEKENMPRPRKVPDADKMLRAARLYYESDFSKKRIAGELFNNEKDIRGVTRLLKDAKAAGLVDIQINQKVQGDLEDQLRTRFLHLHRALIAPGPGGGKPIENTKSYNQLLQQWATLAAEYFEDLYRDFPAGKELHVAVTGSEHVAAFVNAIPQYRRENVFIHVAALIGRGRLSDKTSHIDPIVNASILWSRCGSLPGHIEYATVSPYVIPGPGAVARAAVQDQIAIAESNPTIVEVIKRMNKVDIVVGGIGTVRPDEIQTMSQSLKSRLTMTALLEQIVTPQQLAKEKAVGDFCYCPFDRNGTGRYYPEPDSWRFFITAGHGSDHEGIEFYKHMVKSGRKVVAFAGPFKVTAIKTALAAKIFNVLVTDEHTARQIMADRL
jgi:DNA-binding transcriptional regulator LsrR (DeoR family)